MDGPRTDGRRRDGGSPPSGRRLPAPTPSVLAVAVAGILLLHQVAYLLAHPDPLARAAAGQGHGYLAPLAEVALPLALAGAGWLVACRLTRLFAAPSVTVLAALLGGGFLVQEVVERAVRGVDPAEVLTEPAVLVGVLLAPLLALASGWLLVVVTPRPGSLRPATFLPPPPLGGRLSPRPPLVAARRVPVRHEPRGPPLLPIRTPC